MLTTQDHRYLDACLRYARRHRSRTGTNPSVGTILVRDEIIVGRGITAIGGRPHAERVAIDQAGDKAAGSTAYVSLEPCAHHGATPPCAQALINAGVTRVVTAWIDPDTRVDGKGHAMLREAGIEVNIDERENSAFWDLRGYLNRKQKERPQVTLKLAVSQNGMLGVVGQEIAITGPLSKAIVHRLRAEQDAIMVGKGTVDIDDPELTCRLPGLQHRSPRRYVLQSDGALSTTSHLAKTAAQTPTCVVSNVSELDPALVALGVSHLRAESVEGCLALPEILEDMAQQGISSLMVEGGSKLANSFLAADLVDELHLFTGPNEVAGEGIASPVTSKTIPPQFNLARRLELDDDHLEIYRRK